MEREYFEYKYPDVKKIKAETNKVLSKSEVQDLVLKMVDSFKTGLLYYSYYGKNLEVFTSDKMKLALQTMKKGGKVIHPGTGEEGEVLSDSPIIVCGSLCVKVAFPSETALFDCDIFVQE
jgi:hypothetical protein|nr:MAG TPA: hypothetical protein [Caudoviricetes sp.]